MDARGKQVVYLISRIEQAYRISGKATNSSSCKYHAPACSQTELAKGKTATPDHFVANIGSDQRQNLEGCGDVHKRKTQRSRSTNVIESIASHPRIQMCLPTVIVMRDFCIISLPRVIKEVTYSCLTWYGERMPVHSKAPTVSLVIISMRHIVKPPGQQNVFGKSRKKLGAFCYCGRWNHSSSLEDEEGEGRFDTQC